MRLAAAAASLAGLVACGGGATTSGSAESVSCRVVADAGAGVTVIAGKSATLSANASLVCDGPAPAAPPLLYQWRLTSSPPGSGAALEGSTTATPRLRTDLPGRYVVALAVSDGVNYSLAGPVRVEALPLLLMAPPIAAAGPVALSLDGAGVTDLDNGVTRYRARLHESNGADIAVPGSYLTLWFANGIKMGPMFFMVESVAPRTVPGLSHAYEYDAPTDWVPVLWEYGTPLDAQSPNPALPHWRFPES